MFGIKIGNEWLELGPNFKIRLRLESSLFQTSYESAAYSFPVQIPDVDINRKLTNYPSDVQVKSDANSGIEGSFIFGAVDWPCLIWVDRSIFNKSLQLSLKLVTKNTGKKMLPDLDFGGKRNLPGDANAFPEEPEVTSSFIRSKDRDYYFGVYYNQSPILTSIYNGDGIINDFDSTGTWGAISSALSLIETTRYTPMPYLNYVFKVIAKDMEVRCAGLWWDDAELDSLCIFNNRTIERYFVAPPTIPNGWIYRDLDLKYHVPVMKIDDFLGAVKNTFCMLIETFNGKLTISSYKQILSEFRVKNWSSKSNRVYERYRKPFNGFEIVSTYDPVDKLYELLVHELKSKEIKYLGSLATQPVSGKEGEWFFDTSYKYYRYYDGAGSWLFYSFGSEGVKTGDGELKFETPICAPIFRPQNEIPLLGHRVPWVDMDSEGIYCEFINEDSENFGPRLVFARGFKTDQFTSSPALSLFVPIVSGEAKDHTGASWGDYSLRYNEDEGLYNVFWKDFMKMAVNNDLSFFNLEMDDNDLSNWTFGEWIRIGGEVFLPKALDIEISRSGVEKCLCEVVKKYES